MGPYVYDIWNQTLLYQTPGKVCVPWNLLNKYLSELKTK